MSDEQDKIGEAMRRLLLRVAERIGDRWQELSARRGFSHRAWLDDIAADVAAELIQVEAIVRAAFNHVGMNITRPEVFDGRDSSKGTLARALRDFINEQENQ